jgi:uncharacterized membrane protein YwaF
MNYLLFIKLILCVKMRGGKSDFKGKFAKMITHKIYKYIHKTILYTNNLHINTHPEVKTKI